MTDAQLFDRARDKAFAQIHHLQLSVRRTSNEIKLGLTGNLTEEQLENVLTSTKRELKVWQFISELIEKSNKNE